MWRLDVYRFNCVNWHYWSWSLNIILKFQCCVARAAHGVSQPVASIITSSVVELASLKKGFRQLSVVDSNELVVQTLLHLGS
jgi:hypothetical protein